MRHSSAPRAPAVFVGRAEELAQIARHTETIRLVLLYGHGGVGKTALALRAAEALAEREGAGLAYHRCELGENAAAVADAMLAQLGADNSAHGDRLAALRRAIGEQPVVWIIDDAHHAGGTGLVETLAHVARMRAPVWMLVVSREALDVDPATVDHAVVKLGGLSAGDRRDLLDALSRLYGPPATPVAALWAEESTGNPLRLKQLFSSPLLPRNDDALGLDGLAPPERDLLRLACALRRPLLVEEALTEEYERDAVRDAARSLARRFLVEATHAGTLVVHDLVREAVAASPHAVRTEDHLRCLAYWRRGGEGVGSKLELEVLHHAIQAEADDVALALLGRHAALGRRGLLIGASAERDIAAAIDALARRHVLPLPIVLLRERIRTRQGDAREARGRLTVLARVRGDGDDPLLDLDLGEAAYVLGELVEAAERTRRAAGSETLDATARAVALALHADVQRSQGELARARAALAHHAPVLAAIGPAGSMVARWLEAIIAFDTERYHDALSHIRELRAAFALLPVALPGRPLLTAAERVAALAIGEQVGAAIDPIDLAEQTLFARLVAASVEGEEAVLRGDAQAALAIADRVKTAARDHEMALLDSWAIWLSAEAMQIAGAADSIEAVAAAALGRAEAAVDHRGALRLRLAWARSLLVRGASEEGLLAAQATVLRASGTRGVQRRAEALICLGKAQRGEAFDWSSQDLPPDHPEASAALDVAEAHLVVAEVRKARSLAETVQRAAAAAGWRYLRCRADVILAEVALRRGDASARALAAQAITTADTAGYAREAACARLIAAAAARMQGDHASDPGHAGPTSVRDRLGLDAPMVVRLEHAGHVLHLTRGQWDTWDVAEYDLIVDTIGRRVWTRDRWIDLGQRIVLLDVLASLSTPVGRHVTVDELVRDVWNAEYHPVNHHSRITMAVSRVRKLIGDDRLIAVDGTYALAPRGLWAVTRSSGG